MIELKAGDRVRMETWTRFPYDRSTVGVMTVRAYAAEYNEDQEAAHTRALERGHETAWTYLSPGVIVGGRGEAERLRAKADAEFNRCITLAEGDEVRIEGEVFTVVVPRGNRVAPVNSDAIHFRRVAA